MAGSSKSGIFLFDQFRLDSDKLMLYRDGNEVSIPPKVARTLVVLVESAGTIISKDEVIERVWDDAVVEESNLTQYLYLLRKVLGRMSDGRPYIETLRRRGYRFNGDVERLAEEKPESKPAARPKPLTKPAPHFGAVEREGNVLRLVDWKPVGQAAPAVEETSTAAVPRTAAASPPRRSWIPRVAIAAAILLAVTIGGVLLWPRLMPAAMNTESRKELSVVKLTNGSFPYGATISLDGNVFAFHEADGEVTRMYVQQTGQASPIEIASSKDKAYGVKTFSPDGRSIYFSAVDKKTSVSSLYKIPTMGGPPVKLFDNISGGVTFSPQGKEIAYVRWNPTTTETSLLIADKDGKAERIVLQRREPKRLWSSAAWSPDGKSLAFGEMDETGGRKTGTTQLQILDIATGRVSPLSGERWDNMLRTTWMPDGSGIVTIGTRDGEGMSTRRDQIYYISYPAGVSQRLTNDGHRHEPNSLGVTAKGDILAAVATRSTQIWSLNADGNTNSAVQLTRGTADGRAGIGPLPNGSFGYLARNAEEINIMIANADVSATKQLATGLQFVEELRADPLGRFFVFSSNKDNKHHLFRIDADGGGVRQLTSGDGNEVDSTISPDGKYLAFHSQVYVDGALREIIRRMSTEGGEAVTLYNKNCWVPTYSPDGSLISCVSQEKPSIVIISATDGAEIERHPLPTFATWNFGIGWTPDGSGLLYIVTEKGASNIWVQPRNGGKATPLTNFSSGIIYRYAYSADASKLILSRGYPAQDAILIKNFR